MNWNKYLAITAVFLTAIGIAFAGMVWKVNEIGTKWRSTSFPSRRSISFPDIWTPCSISSSKERLHFYYAPLSVNQWMLAISIQETAVFQNAAETKSMLYSYGGFVVVCFVIYFICRFSLFSLDASTE